MGWQFAAAEFVGGPIMIVLLALTGGFVFRGALVERARAARRHAAARPQAMVGVSDDARPSSSARRGARS